MNVEARVLDMMSNHLLDEVHLSDRLSEDLSMDSLDITEMSMQLEKEFAILIPENEIENWESVKDIVESVALLT
jgi:acyl carrier protein